MNRARRYQNRIARKIQVSQDEDKEDRKASNTVQFKITRTLKADAPQLTYSPDSEDTHRKLLCNPMTRMIFFTFSKAHYNFKLRYDTMFLAI